MNLARMMTDRFFIEDRAGARSGPFKTRFGSSALMVFQDDLVVAPGDRIVRSLPDGSEQRYLVESSSFHTGSRNIPGHFSISVSDPEPPQDADPPATAPQSCGDSRSGHDAAVKFHDIAAALQLLSRAIEHADAPPDQKNEACALLRSLLAHPVVVTVLAGAQRP